MAASSTSLSPAQKASVRALLWPLLVGLAYPAVFLLLCATPAWLGALWFLGFPFSIGPTIWAVAALVALLLAISAVRRQAWWRGISAAILPVIVVLVFANFFSFMRFCVTTGDHLRFTLMRGHYLSDVAAMPATDGPRLQIWNWGGFVTSKGVIYDESDEIASDTPSRQWKERADKTELTCGYGYEPMGDHLYLVAFGC